jgi:hypothetical protein
MLDVEVATEIFDNPVYRLALFEKLPDPAATFIQLQVDPIFDMKKKRLIADCGGNDLRRSREDGVKFRHRLEERRDPIIRRDFH